MATMSLLSARIQVPVSLNNNKATIVSSMNREIPKRPRFFQKRKEWLKKLAITRPKFQEKDFNIGYGNWEEEEEYNDELVIQDVPVQVANELFKVGFKYLDVRTAEEYNDEHVEGSINIPYIEAQSGAQRDYDFLAKVEARFHSNKRAEIVVGSTVGDYKSFKAANELLNAGFTKVTTLHGGYEAWKKSGLPIVVDEKRKVPTHTIEIIKKEEESEVQEFCMIDYEE